MLVPEQISHMDALLSHVAAVLETLQSDLLILDVEVAVGSRLVLTQLPSLADWVEATAILQNSDEYQLAMPVAHVDIDKRTTCTGSLVALNVLMTANHCLPERVEQVSIIATFNLENQADEIHWDKYYCDDVLLRLAEQDIALLRCPDGASGGFQPDDPGQRWEMVTLCDVEPIPMQPIYVVHQSDLLNAHTASKKLSFGMVTGKEEGRLIFDHDADTLRGASGSPVFDAETHQVIGIHVGGVSPSVLDRLLGEGGINQGVSLQGLRKALEESGWWDLLNHC